MSVRDIVAGQAAHGLSPRAFPGARTNHTMHQDSKALPW
ncbi:Hypothetical protein Cul210932_0072 [Corynebacterium ulcerans]|nr:Hypothetical protein Cul210932_0072 [Corynebacterium ulcerans]ALD93813.1 Hypothetical protein Cul131001_0073 [Corynebacterium ulcerans]